MKSKTFLAKVLKVIASTTTDKQLDNAIRYMSLAIPMYKHRYMQTDDHPDIRNDLIAFVMTAQAQIDHKLKKLAKL